MERLAIYYSVRPAAPEKAILFAIHNSDQQENTRNNEITKSNDKCKKKRPHIAVIGAGIIGVTSAVRLHEAIRDIDITIIAEKYSPKTTSDYVAGLWTPYLFGNDQDTLLLHHWCKETYDYWQEIHTSSDAYNMGITKLSGTVLHNEMQEPPVWKNIVESFQFLSKENCQRYGAQYCVGETYTAFTAESYKTSPFLLKKLINNGGNLELKKWKVNNLNELIGKYDIVINCTGIEARFLVPDLQVYPIRGQVTRVHAPFVKTFLMDDDNYIIPCQTSVLLGGTHQENDFNLNVDVNDSHHIWNGCCSLMPSLQNATKLYEWVGLRPARPTVRLEKETITNGNQKMEVIHNYGHGGSGVTFCWGCAEDVANLIKEHFRNRTSFLQSML